MTLHETIRKKVVGKKIVKVELNRHPDGRGGFSYDPVIILDNGTHIAFVAEEEEDSYGIRPVVIVK